MLIMKLRKMRVSRLADTKKAVEDSQALVRECLPKLQEAYKVLVVGAGLCGTAPSSALNSSIQKLDYFAKLSFQDVIEWN